MDSLSSEHAKLLFGPKAMRKQVHVTKIRNVTSPTEKTDDVTKISSHVGSPLSPKHVDIIRSSNKAFDFEPGLKPGLPKSSVSQFSYKRSVAKDGSKSVAMGDKTNDLDNDSFSGGQFWDEGTESEKLKSEGSVHKTADKKQEINAIIQSMLFAQKPSTKTQQKKSANNKSLILQPSTFSTDTSNNDITITSDKMTDMSATIAKSKTGQGIHKRKQLISDPPSLLGQEPSHDHKQPAKPSSRVRIPQMSKKQSDHLSTDRAEYESRSRVEIQNEAKLTNRVDGKPTGKRPPGSPGLHRKKCNPQPNTVDSKPKASSGLDWIRLVYL